MSQKIVLMPLLPLIFLTPSYCPEAVTDAHCTSWGPTGSMSKIALSKIPWETCCAPCVKLVDQRCKLGVCGGFFSSCRGVRLALTRFTF